MNKAEKVFSKIADASDLIWTEKVENAYNKSPKIYKHTLLKSIDNSIKKEIKKEKIINARASRGEKETTKEYLGRAALHGFIGTAVGGLLGLPVAAASQALKISPKFRKVPIGTMIVGGGAALGGSGTSIYELLKGKEKIEKVNRAQSYIPDLKAIKKDILTNPKSDYLKK